MEQTVRPETILIVDDTPANLRLLAQILADRGYTVRAAANGPRALASAQLDPPDLVLLDIRMPGMDGYEVCLRLKENSATTAVPVLFMSALDEVQDKVRAFAVGGLDYITKPFQIEEVVARVQTHLSLRRLQRNLQEANTRMQREMTLAAQVQAAMMRPRQPRLPGWQLATRLLPAKQTSGDFFDVITLGPRRAALLIADVVDKGVGAALYMAMSCALLRTYILEYPDHPARVLEAVNHRILEDTETGQFVTVFLGILDGQAGQLLYGNAGHNPPVLAAANPAAPAAFLTRTGPALGVTDEVRWEQRCVALAPHDSLVLYTDGITDAESEQGEFFGMERFLAVLDEQRGAPADTALEAVVQRVHAFTGSAVPFDDIALMVLHRCADSPPLEAGEALRLQTFAGGFPTRPVYR